MARNPDDRPPSMEAFEYARQLACGIRRHDAEIRRQSDGDARARGHQGHAFERAPKAAQVVVGDGIHDRDMHVLLLQLVNAAQNCFGALSNNAVVDEPDTPAALRLQHPHEIGIRHRRQRMILHAAFM